MTMHFVVLNPSLIKLAVGGDTDTPATGDSTLRLDLGIVPTAIFHAALSPYETLW